MPSDADRDQAAANIEPDDLRIDTYHAGPELLRPRRPPADWYGGNVRSAQVAARSQAGSADATPRTNGGDMTAAKIAELRHLFDLSTKTPWRVGSPNFSCTKHKPPHPGPPECKYEHVGWYDFGGIYRDLDYATREEAERALVAGMWAYEEGGVRTEDDKRLIVAAINALPELLDLAEEALRGR